ncbi:GD15087 [Drosophila simulans]|uniref:GD15087 n=1 Tax=Drosophila simulans TaxID=7240 RepID=B4NTE5_DROSI|nr:GD15087 [Drosophila simulans]
MIVKGTKGKPKLLMGGYEYYRNNSRGSKTYWLCARNRYMRCAARIITCSVTGELIVGKQRQNLDTLNQPKTEIKEKSLSSSPKTKDPEH